MPAVFMNGGITMKKHIILMIGAAVLAALCLVFSFMAYRQYADAKESAEAFGNIAALVVEDTLPEMTEPDVMPDSDNTVEEQDKEHEHQISAYEKYAAVQEQNSDFVGWVSIAGTNINYPVMQTIDEPNYYLKRGFDKSYSDYGVPYMQENCAIGISDNLVIYGHHMNDGSMFADLCHYEDEDFYKDHPTVQFDTLSGYGEYEIVAVFKTVAYSQEGFKYYHFVDAEDETSFDAYIAKCKELTLYDTGVDAVYGDKLITLSTCEYSRTNGRMVVVAKLVTPPAGEVETYA